MCTNGPRTETLGDAGVHRLSFHGQRYFSTWPSMDHRLPMKIINLETVKTPEDAINFLRSPNTNGSTHG